jgi:hypothetical protein
LTSGVTWADNESSIETNKHFSRYDKFSYLNKGVFLYQHKKKQTLPEQGNAAVKEIAAFMERKKSDLNKAFKVPLNFNPNLLTKEFNYAYTLSNARNLSSMLSQSCYPQLIEFPATRTDAIHISIVSARPMYLNLYPPSCQKAVEYILCFMSLKNSVFEFLSLEQYKLLIKNSKFIDKENQEVLRSRFPVAEKILRSSPGFRGLPWGMSIADIKQREKLLLFRISNDTYRSQSVKKDNLENVLQYRFKNGKFCSASYIISIKPDEQHLNKLYYYTNIFGKFYNILSREYGYPTRNSLLLWKDKPCNDMSKWDRMFDNSELKLRDEWKLKNVNVSITLQKKQSEAELIIEYSSPKFASLSQNVSAKQAL